MIARLNISADGGEELTYNSPDFPFRCVPGDLSSFYDYAAGCHWHNDFEILLPMEGDIDYFVNGKTVNIKPGQAIFVNANRLHYGFSGKKTECLYRCLVFHPDIFGSPVMPTSRYVREIAADDRPDYLLLTDVQTLEEIWNIWQIYEEKPHCPELAVLAASCRLMGLIWEKMDMDRQSSADSGWLALRQMVGFLQANYATTIRLEDIAASGAVCRSKCCALFREKLGTTPVGYLNRYRLEKAREKLVSTGETVTAIANGCGFDSPSYFTEMFRKTYGESPREVRKKLHRL